MTEHTVIFFSGVASENGVSCVLITCKYTAYSIACTCSFELDEKKIGNSSKSFGEDLSKMRNLITPRDGEKQAEIGNG